MKAVMLFDSLPYESTPIHPMHARLQPIFLQKNRDRKITAGVASIRALCYLCFLNQYAGMVKFLALFAYMVFITFSSLAHKRRSTGTKNNDGTIVINQKIGDADDHKYGDLTIEKRAGKYYLTFPLLQFMTAADFNDHTNDTMPAGIPVFLTLSDGESISSKTDRNTDFAMHYLWPVHFHPGLDNYAWHYDKNKPTQTDIDHYYYYATTWLAKFECTTSDMLALSKNRITNAHARKDGQIIFIRIKKNQSKKIKKSIAALLRH